MLLEWLIIAFFFGAICLWLGVSQNSFPFAYLGMFVFIVIGLAMLNYGVDWKPTITTIANGVTSTTYTSYTVTNNWIIALLAYSFFYVPAGSILFTTFIALTQRN